MMNPLKNIGFSPLWLILIFCSLYLSGCEKNNASVVPPENLTPITFATTRFIGEAPTYVAYEKGFFRDEGLDVTLKINIMGWQSLKNLLDGEADIATVAELPIVYTAFDKKKFTAEERGDFVIFGELVLSNQGSQQILARRDRSIETPADLRGKKVAVPRGTTVDFFLDAVLTEFRVDPTEVELVNMDVIAQVDAIVKGDVDAIFSWQPHIRNAQMQLEDIANLLQLNLYYHTAWVLTAMKDRAQKNPESLEAVLRALARAKKFMADHPQEAIKIHSRYAEVEQEVTAELWEGVEYEVFLSESLLTTMEDQARWLIKMGNTDQKLVPDFSKYLDLGPMKKVRPEGIMIIQ